MKEKMYTVKFSIDSKGPNEITIHVWADSPKEAYETLQNISNVRVLEEKEVKVWPR